MVCTCGSGTSTGGAGELLYVEGRKGQLLNGMVQNMGGGGGGFQRGSTACIERGFLDVKGQGPCSGVDVPT